MATRGFEFAYSLDGSSPVVRDLPVTGVGTYAIGDACVFASGKLAKIANTVATVSAVIQEARTSGVDGGMLKAAIVTKQQVWRCTADDTTISGTYGTQTMDVVDANTIDASDATNGSLAVLEFGLTDSEGNMVVHVNFRNTSFG